MPVMRKKVCMLGGFAVGKTSLVSRFVSSIFSDSYLTTVGVKIDKKTVPLDAGASMNLVLWDIYGEDEFQTVLDSYLRGASGYLLVADGTRYATLETVVTLQQRAEAVIGRVPFLLLMNKSDLDREWQVDERALVKLVERGWPVLKTSAKTGVGVEEAFMKLARAMAMA
jgi:small GTP-binding protein